MLACAGPHGITITHYLAGKGTNLMIALVLLYKKRQSRQILNFILWPIKFYNYFLQERICWKKNLIRISWDI
jgi:hypothetical protein